MAGVFRREAWALGRPVISAIAFHGVTAILTLVLLFKALGG
jgi:hypothetical protein